MEVWGITGPIGAGKSTAVEYIKGRGIKVIDADQVSRLVVDRNTDIGREGFTRVYKIFGNSVLDNLGNLDRRALRKRIMMHPHERDHLEAALHPLIVDYIRAQMRQWKESNEKIGFVEGARLVESGFHKILAGLIVVTAPVNERVKRLMKRDSMGKDEVSMMCSLQDEGLMKINSKFEWKNDKKAKDLEQTVEAFLKTKGL